MSKEQDAYFIGANDACLDAKPERVSVGRQHERKPNVFRCNSSRWIAAEFLFATESDAWRAIAERLEVHAARYRAAADAAAARHAAAAIAACIANESTDCPDAHLCRHGIDG